MKPVIVLFVCTGNLCRSVMAEGLLDLHAHERDAPLVAQSAGLLTEDTAPPRRVIREMSRRSVDVTGHRSRLLTADLIDAADLVLGMTRAHAWESVELAPDAVGRVFTMREVVRLGDHVGARGPEESIDEWARLLHERRRQLGPSSVTDDIADPLGRGRRVHARVAQEIDGLTRGLVELLHHDWTGEAPPIRWVAPEDRRAAVQPEPRS